MALISLETTINAPRDRVFDLARSIDAHQDSAGNTKERAVGGVTTGLIGLNEEVTWEAVHFGLTQRLRGRITAFDYPSHFRDEMVEGAFRSLRHDHNFEEADGQTVMSDRFEFFAPFGMLGRIAEKLLLERYLRRFLVERNAVLKEMAETDRWRKYLCGATG
ncbi:Polyketide cyclase / dehydrase and lipid transport [Posidoniimonas polymericola]|uniref:Polyketide cyclase / dehydrase and lipid transport n=1 Tax=Posidoniimonas polymericola TaxID=2528002 RepID=A0A5C5YHP6_9BACT|nr:SRPBCC family protein [Posidoniimonas polymericola]TWT74421.1 Polyketide cyclase / dehydrase and lipid transport [Posidoniimonas polymericola]